MSGSDEERGPRRGGSLAQRLKASLDQRIDARRQSRQSAAERRERALKARGEVMADLAEFGRALGHAELREGPESLEIGLGARALRFRCQGEDGEVEVSGDGLSPGWRLLYNDELQRWALHPPHGAARLLFDTGLEELMGRVFQLHPAAEPSAPVSEGHETSPKSETPPRRRL